MAQRQQTC